jgi:hypothetical protein
VQDVAFHKKCGIAVADMVKSQWVYRRLRNFRAGSRPASPSSNAHMVEHAASGAGSTTSRPISGPPSSPTT